MPTPDISHKAIVDYWARREDECGLSVDWSEAEERCWRCGYKSRLQKSHIIPESQHGPSIPSNLVLLCGRCHREAPNVADLRFMWIWLRASCVPLYDTYWTERGIQEFERIFGRKPFTSPEFERITEKQVLKLLRFVSNKATVHFGVGHWNPSTMAFMFAMIEERVTGRLPT